MHWPLLSAVDLLDPATALPHCSIIDVGTQGQLPLLDDVGPNLKGTQIYPPYLQFGVHPFPCSCSCALLLSSVLILILTSALPLTSFLPCPLNCLPGTYSSNFGSDLLLQWFYKSYTLPTNHTYLK